MSNTKKVIAVLDPIEEENIRDDELVSPPDVVTSSTEPETGSQEAEVSPSSIVEEKAPEDAPANPLASVYEKNLSRVRQEIFSQKDIDPYGVRICLENILSNVFIGSITFPSSSEEEVKKAKSALATIIAASKANPSMNFESMILLAEKSLADADAASKSSPDAYDDDQLSAILLREWIDTRVPLSGIDAPRQRTPKAERSIKVPPIVLSWQERAGKDLQGHSIDLLPLRTEEFGDWSQRMISANYELTFQVSKDHVVSSRDFAAGETAQAGVHRLYKILGYTGRLPVPDKFAGIKFSGGE